MKHDPLDDLVTDCCVMDTDRDELERVLNCIHGGKPEYITDGRYWEFRYPDGTTYRGISV